MLMMAIVAKTKFASVYMGSIDDCNLRINLLDKN